MCVILENHSDRPVDQQVSNFLSSMSLETVKLSMKSRPRSWINNLCLLTGPIAITISCLLINYNYNYLWAMIHVA